MTAESIIIDELPTLSNPILIAGFDGWGNAMDVSSSMVKYLIRRLQAKPFARVNPDLFFHYDTTRPYIDIQNGEIKEMSPPGGTFYAAPEDVSTNGLLILKSNEPNLQWVQFADMIFSLMDRLGAQSLITIGSLYDRVLHSERTLSAITNGSELKKKLSEKEVQPITYQGPGAVHSLLHWEGVKRDYVCASIWCHCPYYLQGTAHYGFMSSLGEVLSHLGGFELDVAELDKKWEKLYSQIDDLVANNVEIQEIIEGLKRESRELTHQSLGTPSENSNKVIDLKDFLDSK